MAQILDSFVLNGTQPNFSRDSFGTWDEMNKPDMLSKIDEGHISYCQEYGQHYIFTIEKDNNVIIGYEWVPLTPTGIIYAPEEDKLDEDDFAKNLNPGTIVYARDTGNLFYRYKDNEYIENQNSPSGYLIRIITGDDLNAYITKVDADERYAIKSDISNLIPDYNPDEAYANTWIGNNYIKEFEGQTGEDLSKSSLSYTEVFDKLFFQEYIPRYTQPSTDIDVKSDLFEQGFEGYWYDEEKKIIIIRRDSTAPDASYFIPSNVINSIIQYPEMIELGRRFTNDVITDSKDQNVSKPFCKIKSANGEWDYYKQKGEIYHIPNLLTEPEYRYYLCAKFHKHDQLLKNDGKPYNGEGVSDGYWNEDQVIESKNYITIVTSLPVKYNTKDGTKENPLILWSDEMVDYFELPATCLAKQQFSLPRKAKKIYVWNDLCGYAQNSSFDEDENVLDGYFTYTYDHMINGHRGEVKIKVEF